MRLLLRLSFNPKTLEKVQFSEKFGCPPNEEAEELLKLAKELGLNVAGICFHIGIGCIDCKKFKNSNDIYFMISYLYFVLISI